MTTISDWGSILAGQIPNLIQLVVAVGCLTAVLVYAGRGSVRTLAAVGLSLNILAGVVALLGQVIFYVLLANGAETVEVAIVMSITGVVGTVIGLVGLVLVTVAIIRATRGQQPSGVTRQQ